MNRPRLRPDWDAWLTDDGLRVANELRGIRIRAPREHLRAVGAHLLSVEIPPPDLPGFDTVIQTLNRVGCLVRSERDRERADPMSNQLTFFSCFTDSEVTAQHRLRNATILILGLGGTGSIFLQHMVGAGVGAFVLVDHDCVELSNLNRQHIYTRAQVGSSKVVAARRYVQDRRPEVRVSTYERFISSAGDVADLMRGEALNLAFIAVDTPVESIAHDVSSALAAEGVPFLHAGVGIRKLHVGHVGTTPLPRLSNARTTTASLSTTNAMAAGLAAHRALEYLTGFPMPFEIQDEPQ